MYEDICTYHPALVGARKTSSNPTQYQSYVTIFNGIFFSGFNVLLVRLYVLKSFLMVTRMEVCNHHGL